MPFTSLHFLAKAKAATTTKAKKLAKLNKLWNERIDKPGRVKYEEMMRLVNYIQNRNVKIKNYNNYVHHANSARRPVNKTNLYDFFNTKAKSFSMYDVRNEVKNSRKTMLEHYDEKIRFLKKLKKKKLIDA